MAFKMTNPFKKTYKMNKAGNICDAYGKQVDKTPPKTEKEKQADVMAMINFGKTAFTYKKQTKKQTKKK